MNSLIASTSQTIGHTVGSGARGLSFWIFGNEILGIFFESRWVVFLLLVLIVADFTFGRKESARHYLHCKDVGDKVRMDYFRWHWSRAVRRTFNKISDYFIMMLICWSIGMALLEPLGVSHIWGAWAGGVLACVCELVSIFGHFFYLHGVKVEKRSIGSFLKALAIALTKHKDPDVGESIEEAFEETEKEQKKQE